MKQTKDNNRYDMFPVDDISVDIEFDVERIQALTFAKLHTEQKECSKMKKTSVKILIAAALVAVLSTTVWAAANVGLFGKVFGDVENLKTENVKNVGITAENTDVKITVEQFVSDGYQQNMIVSAIPKTKKMQTILKNYGISASMILPKGEETLFSGGGMASWQDNDENKIYYHIRSDAAEQIVGQTVTWAFTWKKWEEQEPLTEPLEINIPYENTIGVEKGVTFSGDLPIRELHLRSFGVEVVSDIYTGKECIPVVLVWKDGSEKVLGHIEKEDRQNVSSSWLHSGFAKDVATDFDEEHGKVYRYVHFSSIIEVEDVAGVRIHDTLYPFAE